MKTHDTKMVLTIHRRNIKPIQIRSAKQGILHIRVLLTFGDLVFFSKLTTQDLPPREFTVQVIQHQLAKPELDLETVRAWTDKQLTRAAIAWAKHKLTIRKEIPPNSHAYEEFKQATCTYVANEERNLQKAVETMARSVNETFRHSLLPAIENFQGSLNEVLKPAMENMQETILGISEYFSRQQEVIRNALVSFGAAITRSLEEARAASQVLGAPLTQAGFWIPPSAPFELLHFLRHLMDTGELTPEKIRQAITDYFDADEFACLKNMVKGWRSNPY